MNHREVAHRWAQRRGDSGKGHSLFYEGDSIYSYGYHFKVAQWVESPKGEWFVLFNSGTYSMSTSRHQSYVRQAIPGGTRMIAIGGLTNHIPDVLRRLEVAAEELYGRYERARVHKDFYMSQLGYVLDDIVFICGQYDLESTYKDGIDAEKLEAARKAEAEREKAEQLRLQAEHAEKIERWLNGEEVYLPHMQKIRLRVCGDNIETSWGANVPLDVAPHLWRLVQHCRENNVDYQPHTEVKVGYYKLDCVARNGDIKVGCHTIEYDELERIAKQRGYIKEIEHAQ